MSRRHLIFRHRTLPAIMGSLLISTGIHGHCFAGYLSVYANCSDGSHVSLRWYFSDDPANPVIRPEWTGYDVYRRFLTDCGNYVRVNAEPFPRFHGTPPEY